MGFVMFTEAGSRNKEFISITSNKTFGLSRNFLQSHNITANHKVVLYYDVEEKKIAFYFSMFETKNGISVRVPDSRYGATIVSKSFFDLQKIDADMYSGRYDEIEQIKPSLLGADDIAGDAFVITLKAKKNLNKDTVSIVTEENKDVDQFYIPFQEGLYVVPK